MEGNQRTFLLGRNPAPYADWLMIVEGAACILYSFENRQGHIIIHNRIRVWHPGSVMGMQEVTEKSVQHVLQAIKEKALAEAPRAKRA